MHLRSHVAAQAQATPERREPEDVGVMQAFFVNFGRSLANVIDLLDPDVVILGGGVSKFDAIYSEGVTEVARFDFQRRT